MEYKIYLGTMMVIKLGFMKGSMRLMYCGMPDNNTFVISPFVTKGYNGFSPNVYYDFNSTSIQVLNKHFEVLEVSPDYIILGD